MLFRYLSEPLIRAGLLLSLAQFVALPCPAQSNFTVRVMAANLPGDPQKYEAAQIRILQGLKADVVAIQEFNYLGNTPMEIRAFVDTAFGTNFAYYRESGAQIPNGIVSRWPILSSGSWPDPEVGNRGFAWAQIDLPGSNDLYVVSVHLLSSGSEAERNNEALSIKGRVQTNFPANAWVIVAGDMNTDARTEASINTFKTFLSDSPVPSDAIIDGDEDTNLNRSKPYDYVLPSFSLTNFLTNVVIGAQSFSKGLVFDSRIFTPLSAVAPVLSGDSSECQHMAVIKDFHVTSAPTNPPPEPPEITDQPDSLAVQQGANATFNVSATGAPPLVYQWRFKGTNLSGATSPSYTRFNAQPADAGAYDVVVQNSAGSILSTEAVLTVLPPATNVFSGVLSGWDVSGQSAFGVSPMPPTTSRTELTVDGLTRGAGVTTNLTGAARAWGGNGFDAVSAGAAMTAEDVATFGVRPHAGYRMSLDSISRLDYRRSSSGPPSGVLQYRVANGPFIDILDLAYMSSSSGGASLPPVDLSGIAELQNVGAGTNIIFRFVNYGATSSGGTWYVFDVVNSTAPDLVLSGSLAPVSSPPPAPPDLVNPTYSAGLFQFQLDGQTGATYVVEFTTNLVENNWVPAVTNAAPFIYSDSNAAAVPGRLFRGRVQP